MRAHSHLIPSDDCTEQLDFTSQSIRWLHMAVMIIIFIINHLFIFNCFLVLYLCEQQMWKNKAAGGTFLLTVNLNPPFK